MRRIDSHRSTSAVDRPKSSRPNRIAVVRPVGALVEELASCQHIGSVVPAAPCLRCRAVLATATCTPSSASSRVATTRASASMIVASGRHPSSGLGVPCGRIHQHQSAQAEVLHRPSGRPDVPGMLRLHQDHDDVVPKCGRVNAQPFGRWPGVAGWARPKRLSAKAEEAEEPGEEALGLFLLGGELGLFLRSLGLLLPGDASDLAPKSAFVGAGVGGGAGLAGAPMLGFAVSELPRGMFRGLGGAAAGCSVLLRLGPRAGFFFFRFLLDGATDRNRPCRASGGSRRAARCRCRER